MALIRVGLVLAVVGLLGGCSSSSFFGRQYTNLTAYYNKFYNANKAFEKGRRSIEDSGQPVDRTQYMDVFLKPTDGGDEEAFEDAIQKSADVLRDNPDSKWVDDALLLIGKSYFYQKNYVGAVQKFRETIALDDERTQEARFWLARTLVTTRRYEEAESVLRTGLQAEEPGPWTARLHLVRGQLLVQQEQWEEAVQALNKGLQGEVSEKVGARSAFLLGQVLETIGKPTAARTAYQTVQDYDPRYALDFVAQLSEIELQGIHGNTEQAFDRLRDLERDEKNFERRGEMAVVRARIYRARGENDRAQQTLRRMLYGDEAPSGSSRGRLHYDLARLYRDVYKDFSQAAAHFDTASTTLGSRGGQRGRDDVQRVPDAPDDPGTQADRYRDLAKRSREVARMDSLLRVGRMSESEFKTFVQELRRQRQEKIESQNEERRRQERGKQLRGGGEALAKRRQDAAPAADTRSSDAGFLFYNDPARVQEGQRRFEQTWGDRPRVDNWRRRAAIRGSQSASGDRQEGDRQEGEPSAEETAPKEETSDQRSSNKVASLDLSAIPRDSASQAKMEADRAVARYKLANSLFLAASRPDSAATWYRRILQENGDHPVAKRALYALAEAYHAQGDTTAAQQSYGRLVEQYPDTDLAARARRQLGQQEETPADNRTALADSAYARAYEKWQRGEPGTAFPELLDVASQYPDTEAAPRALLAASIVYWKQLQQDSTSTSRRVLERHLRELQSSDSTTSAKSDSTLSPRSRAAPNRAAVSDSVGADSAEVDKGPRSRRAGADSTLSPTQERATTRTSQPGGGQDTLRTARADSTVKLDREGAPDSTRVPSDTAASAGTPARADSTQGDVQTRTEPDKYTPLESLLNHLKEQYPQAPQVKRARVMLDLIKQQKAGSDSARADTSARDLAAADTSATVSGQGTGEQDDEPPVRRDSLTAAQHSSASDSGRSRSREQAAEQMDDADTDEQALPAPSTVEQDPAETENGSVDRSRGGWTLLVQTFASSQEASTRVAEVERELGDKWPVDMLEETTDDTTKYRLVVGQFQSEQAATQAQGRVAEQLSSRPKIWSIPNPSARP